MTGIKQLPKNVSNQISAGEVVERPASVVKELVENSIDASAKKIIIDIKNGGRDKIRVKDDGVGIAADELELAFARYATSKIDNINDLYSIKTLGFRGEALASISAVSKVKISSKINNAIKGKTMILKGGEIEKKEPAGVPVGTDIVVSDLFYNTPARYKYLKTTNTEFGHISKIITREALAYPEIQFQLKHNNKDVFKTLGTGNMIDTIYAIYGQEMVDNLILIDYEESYIKLNGYIAKPDFYRSSRVYELFFVNKRSVYNQGLTKGTEAGYRGLLPPGKFPVVFIKLTLNQILVDVNVHPTKREIKFSREKIVQNIMEKGIKNTLNSIELSPRINVNKKKKNIQQIKFETDQITKNRMPTIEKSKTYDYTENINKYKNNDIKKETKFPTNNYSIKNNTYKHKKIKETTDDYKTDKYRIDNTEKNPANNVENKLPEKIINIMGQIKNTYIIAEGRDGLFIIDQHNAHERILFNNLYQKYKEQKIRSQSLLLPVTIEISLEEIEIVKKHLEELKKLGIEIESFGGNSFIVKEVPIIMKKRSNKKIIRELIDNLLTGGDTKNQAEMIKTIILYMSCRGAIKAGKILAEKEMQQLVIDLFNSSNPYRCPHGRPIIIHLSYEDIDKGMGR